MDKRSYIIRKIPKRNGEFRIISEPRPRLKIQQESILKWLMARRVAPSRYAHAFIKGRSIATNAKLHIDKRVIVKVDIKDFFGSITKAQVISVLTKEGLGEDDTDRIAGICTLDGYLPQGAPTSPLLSNLVLKWKLDYRLAGLAQHWADGRRNTTYTRYCDDMIFSSQDARLNMILPIVEKFVRESGFVINRAKTKVLRSGSRQVVTGVIVNKTPNICRIERRRFRAELHNIKKSLIEDKGKEFNIAKLQGKAAFIRGINPETGKRFMQKVEEIKSLLVLRERIYQNS
jgi:hypothetical protein